MIKGTNKVRQAETATHKQLVHRAGTPWTTLPSLPQWNFGNALDDLGTLKNQSLSLLHIQQINKSKIDVLSIKGRTGSEVCQ